MLRIYAFRRANGTQGTVAAPSAKAVRTYLTYQCAGHDASSVRVATLPEVCAMLANAVRLGKLKASGREYAPDDAAPADFVGASRIL